MHRDHGDINQHLSISPEKESEERATRRNFLSKHGEGGTTERVGTSLIATTFSPSTSHPFLPADKWTFFCKHGRVHLTECIHQSVIESQVPTESSTDCLLILTRISSRLFCGGVDFLKPINEYIVSDKFRPPQAGAASASERGGSTLE